MMTSQATVLLVEDSAEVRNMVSWFLEEEGYGVVARASADEC
jgi:CheY-like chemotaxis protein